MISEYNDVGNFITSMKKCIDETELKYEEINKIMNNPEEVKNFTKALLF